jgi:poly-gamma-glutamate synthesis protein (capsule biosynthesis protein)
MAFTGDALWHSPLWRQAERNFAATGRGTVGMDFTPMLAPLRPLLESADVAVCHLETPIAPDGEQYTTFPLYGVPPGVVDALTGAGFDRCSTASNHTVDRGVPGIDRTISVLESLRLGSTAAVVGSSTSCDDRSPTPRCRPRCDRSWSCR